jgi:predicted NBD/HSP70 family sugar kinase
MSELRIAALDIGGTRVKSCLFTGGEPSPVREIDTLASRGPEQLLRRAGELLAALGEFDAVGVSTAGQVDAPRGTIRYANENLPGYTGTDVRGFFTSRFGVPCAVMNDAYAAALGEGTHGAARGFSDYLCLTYGTGVGGAVFLGGRPYYGAGGSANPLPGGLILHPEQMRRGDPFAGTYERAASAAALVAAAAAVDPAIRDGRALFARLDEPALQAVLERWLDEAAAGLCSLLHLFNVPCAVLGGGVLEQPAVIAGIRERVRAWAIPGFQDAAVLAARLGNRAGLFGAMELVRRAGEERRADG